MVKICDIMQIKGENLKKKIVRVEAEYDICELKIILCL